MPQRSVTKNVKSWGAKMFNKGYVIRPKNDKNKVVTCAGGSVIVIDDKEKALVFKTEKAAFIFLKYMMDRYKLTPKQYDVGLM